jgi:hypothetical protein
VHCQRVYVGRVLQPGTALVVVCLAVVTLPSHSTAPTVAGCRLVGCSVFSGRPLCCHAVSGVSLHVCVCLGPVLASHAPSQSAAAAADWRGLGWVPIAGWSCGGVGPERGLLGGGRRGWCEEWVRCACGNQAENWHQPPFHNMQPPSCLTNYKRRNNNHGYTTSVLTLIQ